MPRSTAARPCNGAKLHLAIDALTGEIVAHVPTDKDVSDIAAVPGLLVTVEGPVASLIADEVLSALAPTSDLVAAGKLT